MQVQTELSKFYYTRQPHYSYTILFNVLVLVCLFCLFSIAEFYVLLIVHLITICYNLHLHTTRSPTYSDIYQRSF